MAQLIQTIGQQGPGQIHHAVLLKAQQFLTIAAKQQAITGLQTQLSQRWLQSLALTVHIQHIHIKAALQSAAAQGHTAEGGDRRQHHFREIAVLTERPEVFSLRLTMVGKPAAAEHEIHSPEQPHGDANGGETEQFQAAIAKAGDQITGQQAGGGADQRESATNQGGEGQGHQDA